MRKCIIYSFRLPTHHMLSKYKYFFVTLQNGLVCIYNFCCDGETFSFDNMQKTFYFSFLSHSYSIKFYFSFTLIIFFVVNTLIKWDNKEGDRHNNFNFISVRKQ